MIDIILYIVPFLVVLTVLVFVHELGHYLVARWNGVRVEVFSVGFGPEIFGWYDRHETRWKVSWIPLGGYVKFFGDMNAASAPDFDINQKLTESEKDVAFHHKRLGQRAAIVAAGPIANFIYAIVVLAGLFWLYGQRVTPPEIGRVIAGGAGDLAGFEVGDIVTAIDGESINRFEQIQELVFLNPNRTLNFEVERQGRPLQLQALPEAHTGDGPDGVEREFGDMGIYSANPAKVGEVTPDSPAERAGMQPGDLILQVDGRDLASFEDLQDVVKSSEGRPLKIAVARRGDRVEMTLSAEHRPITLSDGSEIDAWLIGIRRAERPLYQHGPVSALGEAVRTSYSMIVRTLDYLGQMIVGDRGTEDLGGPLRIAQVSGQAAQIGIEQLVMLSVLLSLNLGLINLFPIPVLDGGHLLFYAVEALRGRPMTDRMQEYFFRVGFILILSLMVFATWNDLVNLRVVDFFSGLFS